MRNKFVNNKPNSKKMAAFRFAKRLILGGLIASLGIADKIVISTSSLGSKTPSPIFIVGYSRSGTTLVYQSLVHSVRLTYFPNWYFSFRAGVSAIAPVLGVFGGFAPPGNFTSEYGITKSWNEPNTGSRFWMKVFRDKNGRQTVNLSDRSAKTVRKQVRFLSRICHAPFVSKWTPLSVRISALRKVFPDAIFVNVSRDPVDVLSSCLRASQTVHGRNDVTLVTWPVEFRLQVQNEPIERAITEHYKVVTEEIERHFFEADDVRVFYIDYENFCEDPNAVVEDFVRFYNRQSGHQIRSRNRLPYRFVKSKASRAAAEAQKLIDATTDLLSQR